jgi:hypothetical protein
MTAAAPPVVTDPAEVFPDLARLSDAASFGDLGTVLTGLADLRARDPDEHEATSEVLARSGALDAPLDAHLEEDPTDREARTLWVHRMLVLADEAEDPERVVEAELWLIRLCAEDPTDPHPWTLRLATSRALGLGTAETWRRHGRLAEHSPHLLTAHRQMVDGLAPRWGGSWDEAIAFARSVSSTAPFGSPAAALVVAAHLARWFDESGGGNPYYLARPEVAGEAESASDRWLEAAGPLTLATVVPHTELAVVFGLAGSRARAAAHFRALGPLVDPGVWERVGQHHERLEAVRAAALTVAEEDAS